MDPALGAPAFAAPAGSSEAEAEVYRFIGSPSPGAAPPRMREPGVTGTALTQTSKPPLPSLGVAQPRFDFET